MAAEKITREILDPGTADNTVATSVNLTDLMAVIQTNVTEQSRKEQAETTANLMAALDKISSRLTALEKTRSVPVDGDGGRHIAPPVSGSAPASDRSVQGRDSLEPSEPPSKRARMAHEISTDPDSDDSAAAQSFGLHPESSSDEDAGADDVHAGRFLDQIDNLLNSTPGSRDSGTKADSRSDAFLAQLAAELHTDEGQAAPISTTLQEILEGALSKPIGKDKLQEKLAKYRPPENCPSLLVPQVNQELWENLPFGSKCKDLALQRIQQTTVKSSTAVVQLIDLLLIAKNTPAQLKIDEILRLAFDSLLLSTNALHEISARRKEQIRPELDKQYQRICGRQLPISKHLFGEDLSQAIKDLNETQKLTARVLSRSRGRGGFPASRSGYFPRPKGKFSARASSKNGRGGGRYPGRYPPQSQGHRAYPHPQGKARHPQEVRGYDRK